MNILAVDPAAGASKGASKMACAILSPTTLLRAYSFDRPGGEVDLLTMQFHCGGPDASGPVGLVAIETPWLGLNVKTTLALQRVVSRWEAAAELVGVPVRFVAPQAWMRALNRSWRFGAGSKKSMPTIIDYLRRRWKIEGEFTTDEYCAIGIGTFVMDQEVQIPRIGRQLMEKQCDR